MGFCAYFYILDKFPLVCAFFFSSSVKTLLHLFLGSRFEQLKMEVRKGSMVNVNPTNTRPPNDTPEIRKYKKKFNSEILCAALWGENRFRSPKGEKKKKNRG